MRVDIITCLPKLLESPCSHFIFERAIAQKKLDLHIHDLRDYTPYKHGKIDDYIYGGEAGMLLMIAPIANCINTLKAKNNYEDVIYMAPDGELFDQKTANQLSIQGNLIILCGHYKGIDERIRAHFITREISIGNYVLSGGELPAIIMLDAVVRLIPGVMSDMTSALADSFQNNLLAPPAYTRPANFQGLEVPPILYSGDHKAIQKWNHDQALARTKVRRPEILEKE